MSSQVPAATMPPPDLVLIRRALISVSDKTGVVELAKKLSMWDVEILSTGGTAKALKDAGIPVRDVADHTGAPEIMDGRVKTLHPKIHGGILARRDNADHKRAMADHQIGGIDLVIVNLYPFVETIARGASFAEAIENIDIGGPAMVRASAKNHEFVTIVTDPADYTALLADLNEHNGATTYALRKRLAGAAYAMTASYDAHIVHWFAAQDENHYPPRTTITGTRHQTLRYGENPHQNAAVYLDGGRRPGIALSRQLQGKELSYNNFNDTDAAFELVAEFDEPAVAIIKHANPCGVAVASTPLEAYRNALRCDPVSAFGGIIALNRALSAETAQDILKTFCEVIIAPAIDDEALPLLSAKTNVRVLVTGDMPKPHERRQLVKTIAGGFLLQDADTGRVTIDDLEAVTKRKPTAEEVQDMLFAFSVAKHVKSNAIVYAKDKATVGIGAGQMSRIDSTRIAAHKARGAAQAAGIAATLTTGSVVASDAFFPFADGLIAAAEAGATAVIQPGGSMRDAEVIEAADKRGLAMVFTGMRHFRH